MHDERVPFYDNVVGPSRTWLSLYRTCGQVQIERGIEGSANTQRADFILANADTLSRRFTEDVLAQTIALHRFLGLIDDRTVALFAVLQEHTSSRGMARLEEWAARFWTMGQHSLPQATRFTEEWVGLWEETTKTQAGRSADAPGAADEWEHWSFANVHARTLTRPSVELTISRLQGISDWFEGYNDQLRALVVIMSRYLDPIGMRHVESLVESLSLPSDPELALNGRGGPRFPVDS